MTKRVLDDNPVDVEAVKQWAFDRLVTSLRDFKAGTVSFHAVVAGFQVAENTGVELLTLDAFCRGFFASVECVQAAAAVEVTALPVRSLALPNAIFNALEAEGIKTFGELAAWSESRLYRVPMIGRLALRKIVKALAVHGLSLSR